MALVRVTEEGLSMKNVIIISFFAGDLPWVQVQLLPVTITGMGTGLGTSMMHTGMV
jgi:hypothetical protein